MTAKGRESVCRTICNLLNTCSSSVLRTLLAAVLFVGAAGCPGFPPDNSAKTGDVNGDGVLDESDLNAIQAAFGTSEGDPGFNPAADLTGDGQIGLDDLQAMVQLLDAQ